MRLVLAIVAFLLAAAMITVGLVQRTVLAPASSIDVAVTSTGSAQVTIIDGATLRAHEGRQTITISGASQIAAAYGRTVDVEAWIGDAAYNELTIDAETGQLVSTRHAGTSDPLPDLYDADLWLEDYRDIQQLRLSVTLPEDVTLIIGSAEGMPAPRDIAISWPLDTSTPWSGPLIIGGAALLVTGLILFVMAIYRIRNDHGPRRKMPKLPKRKAITSVRPGTRPVSGSRARAGARASAKVGAGSALGLVVIATLSLGALPPSAAHAAPTPTPSPTPVEVAPIPAVTTVQLDRIIEKTLATVTQADTALDRELLETRMTGPALALKSADYTLRGLDAAALGESPVIPTGGVVALSLPQQVPADTPSWPRSVLVVVAPPEALDPVASTPKPTPTADGATPEAAATEEPVPDPPVVMLLSQATPRDNYKAEYLMTLQADVPEVAASTVGAPVLRPDSPLLSTKPETVDDGYADLLALGEASEWADRFALDNDAFAAAWGVEAQASYQAGQSGLESPNTVSYVTDDTDSRLVTLATADGGALVTGTVYQQVVVTPSESGAKVIAQGKVLTLSGVERSEIGYALNYIGQLLFFVPPLGSDQPITVLAYAQGLAGAVEAS
ncbi:MAG TPA: hypothetical protein VNQ48_02715 [Microbacteriaceae bacterium]|nr:hypothetical protein [Microbacteriaceae bacterium]